MLRIALLGLLLLAPTALAIDPTRFPPREYHVDAIVCRVDQTFYVDNTFTTLRCAPAGIELLHHTHGSGFGGFMCTTRVAGVTVYDCWDGILP